MLIGFERQFNFKVSHKHWYGNWMHFYKFGWLAVVFANHMNVKIWLVLNSDLMRGNREQGVAYISRVLEQMEEDWEGGEMKVVPGLRFFTCIGCGEDYEEATRDCHTPSLEECPFCGDFNPPYAYEEHPEWPVTASGNLIGR